MRVRDLLIVAAVLLVGGFAAADALRGDPDSGPPPTTAGERESPETRPSGTVRIETVQGIRRGLLGGRLVYTDQACVVRELDLPSGTLFPLERLRGTCELVSAPRTERIAFSLPSPRRDVLPYRVVDLDHPGREPLGFRARAGSVVWSPDGQRLAWCEPSGRGQELELGREPRTLSGCPIAYAPDGTPVYARGRTLAVGGRTVLRAASRIETVSFGSDGSLGVLEAGGRVLLYGGGSNRPFTLARIAYLPPELRGLPILFSPTNCQAALLSSEFPPTPTVSVVNLRPCAGSHAPVSFAGRAAAWSPDGSRLAVAERRRVTVHSVIGPGPSVRLPLIATDLAWKG